MCVVVVVVSLCLFLSDAIEEVSRDVVYVDEFHSRFLCHFAVPLSVCVVSAFNLSPGPFIARSERQQ